MTTELSNDDYLHSTSYVSTVGSDYTAVNQVLVFNASASRVCFATSSLEDGFLEYDEDYRLRLSQTPIEQGVTLNPSEATVTIADVKSECSLHIIA